jgi:type IV secretory pathway VirB9-like protein
MQRENTNARYEEYKNAVEHYDEAEKNYIVLLENLERYPKDEYLLMRKKIMRKDIEQNRLLMLQARTEFEKALQEWDKQVQKMETGLPSDSLDLRQIFGLPTPKDTLLRYSD